MKAVVLYFLLASVAIPRADAQQADVAVNGAEIESPSPLKRVSPVYPASQQRKGNAGLVELSIMVDAAGKPFDIFVVRSSHKHFERSAMAAAGKYQYSPARQNGKSVAARDRLIILYEREGQLNTLSKGIYKWIGKDGGLFAGEDAQRQAALKSLKRATRLARSRCDYAWVYLFESQFALKFEATDQQIESLQRALVFDYRVEPEMRCFEDQHKAALSDSLLRQLIDAGRVGEALRLYKTLRTAGLVSLSDKFAEEIQNLKESAPEIQLVTEDHIDIENDQIMVELFSKRFKVDVNDNQIERMSLRCDNGFEEIEITESSAYEVAGNLKACQLRIELINEDRG